MMNLMDSISAPTISPLTRHPLHSCHMQTLASALFPLPSYLSQMHASTCRVEKKLPWTLLVQLPHSSNFCLLLIFTSHILCREKPSWTLVQLPPSSRFQSTKSLFPQQWHLLKQVASASSFNWKQQIFFHLNFATELHCFLTPLHYLDTALHKSTLHPVPCTLTAQHTAMHCIAHCTLNIAHCMLHAARCTLHIALHRQNGKSSSISKSAFSSHSHSNCTALHFWAQPCAPHIIGSSEQLLMAGGKVPQVWPHQSWIQTSVGRYPS